MSLENNTDRNNLRKLRIFICYAFEDKPIVRKLYFQLCNDNFDPWLNDEKLLPGQVWKVEITKAVRNSDVVIVCLSGKSINKPGYIQNEIRVALDTANEHPQSSIFIIPLKLEELEEHKVPEQLRPLHWGDYSEEKGYKKLIRALRFRANELGLISEQETWKLKEKGKNDSESPSNQKGSECSENDLFSDPKLQDLIKKVNFPPKSKETPDEYQKRIQAKIKEMMAEIHELEDKLTEFGSRRRLSAKKIERLKERNKLLSEIDFRITGYYRRIGKSPKDYGILKDLSSTQEEKAVEKYDSYDFPENLSPALRKKITAFLKSLPDIHDSKAQRALVYEAGLDSRLQNQLSFGDPPMHFVQNLVTTLFSYGKLNDGRYALEAILESAKNYVGQDKRDYCDTLIQELCDIRNG